jgi:beta-lactamase superfamily II metal-dependent hydrolase
MSRAPFAALRMVLATLLAGFALAGELKVHIVNVGWGSSVLLEGPSGVRVLLEGGDDKRAQALVDYLRSQQVPPGGIAHVLLGHNHADHGGGLAQVWRAGFVAATAKCYYNGSTHNAAQVQAWFAGAGGMPSVLQPSATPFLDLGDGAEVCCVASNGRTLSPASATSQSPDENDNSIGLLIRYHGFHYLWTSDMGGYSDDGCSGRSSLQANREVPMIEAMLAAGLIQEGGVEVLHVGHHGSESSCAPAYVRHAHPLVAVLSTGRGQSSGWDLPRKAVVDRILLATGPGSCTGFAEAPLVLQTEDGDRNDQGKRSTSGYAVGNILVRTDGAQFWLSAQGEPSGIFIADGSTVDQERQAAGLKNAMDPRGRAFPVHGGAAPAPGAFLEVEPNDTRALANAVGDGAARIVGRFQNDADTDDWFALALLPGHTLAVDMTGPEGVDYDLFLYSKSGALLAKSEGDTATEHVAYKNTNVNTPKTVYVKVHRYGGASGDTPYTLALSR